MFKDRLENIIKDVEEAKKRSGRTHDVTIVAVSKRFPLEDIENAYDTTGHTIYGENRIQEALDKSASLMKTRPDVQVHFIGHIQTNKVKYLKNNFALIHSVDSEKLAEFMQKHFEKEDRVQDVLVQVNIAHDENKSGTGEEDAFQLCDFIRSCPNLHLRGLMMMPPLVDDVEDNRCYFTRMKKMFDKCNDIKGYNIDTLSMGMSGDYQVAVEEGSTMVRVGTALFGHRQY
ncbi:alanine racemase domain protein [Denitrovibrio acetiphilus DSM 12809]|uniref:Pyridoxal phosphate homeostasis protein n=1 Tax=Denitrovibrio acetiphilus (strain DSM 12809 / NBRC 114555 / N2460) TaxID=522772 RepID=D4H7Y0_DENA2|nr:YggS family pyridoxal phosphate-dependent enzyme [Denitrovibrio acetiphilus]ADD68129.1 alanine racemase domain protein [Denitrovibrio acetiphilus DSM 12809]